MWGCEGPAAQHLCTDPKLSWRQGGALNWLLSGTMGILPSPGHTELAGYFMGYTQINNGHPELRLLSPTSLKPCDANQERAQDGCGAKPLDVKGNTTKIPFQQLLWQSACRGTDATQDFILTKIAEVQISMGSETLVFI